MLSHTTSRLLRYLAFAAVLIISARFFYIHIRQNVQVSEGAIDRVQVDYSAANATLGFEAILVTAPKNIPERHRWRVAGLLEAAERTGLQVQMPAQPEFTKEEMEQFSPPSDGKSAEGNALAWLGHLHTLGAATNYTTALILEDDADWDVEIRSAIDQIATSIREITEYQPSQANETLPYGDGWDVLWLGHCGDTIRMDKAIRKFEDPTVPPYFGSWEKQISPDPHHTRWVHYSTGPICSFAFAITGAAAKKILATKDWGKDAFDIFLHILCKGEKLRCITVNPELFHHHEMAGQKDSLIGGQSDSETIETEMTSNIWHSARCNSKHYDSPLLTCMQKPPKEKN